MTYDTHQARQQGVSGGVGVLPQGEEDKAVKAQESKRSPMKRKRKKPLFWFGCYGTWSQAKEDCARCEQLKWCKDGTDKPTGKCVDIDRLMSMPIPNDDTSRIEVIPQYEYFDEQQYKAKDYSREDVVDVLVYVLSLNIREFVTLQAKIIYPSLSFQDNARRMSMLKVTFNKRIASLIKRRPELEKCLRKRRKSI